MIPNQALFSIVIHGHTLVTKFWQSLHCQRVLLLSLPFHFYLHTRAAVLKLLHASKSSGLLKHILPGPKTKVSALLTCSQIPKLMLMLLVRGPHFENHCPGFQVPITLRGNPLQYYSRYLPDLKPQKKLLLKHHFDYYSIQNKPQLMAFYCSILGFHNCLKWNLINSASQIYFSPTNLINVFRIGLLGFPLHSKAYATFTSCKATLFPPPLYLPEGGFHQCICQNHVWLLSAAFYLYGLSFYQVLTDTENPQEPKI